MSNFEDIIQMRKHYGLETPSVSKQIENKDQDWFNFRKVLALEEHEEFVHSFKEGDITEVFDALLDTVVIAMGTAAGLGLDWSKGWDEVMRSNMQKVRSEDPSKSKRKDSLDLIKPKGWVAPNLSPLIGQSRKPNFYQIAENLAKRKAVDYQHSVLREEYFPFGLVSYMQMIHIKSTRLRSLVDNPKPSFESIEDTLIDMINYCNFMLEFCKKED